MFARRVDITAGTPGHRYLVERQWKCLEKHTGNTRFRAVAIEVAIGLSGKLSGFVIFSTNDSACMILAKTLAEAVSLSFTANERESLGP